MFLEMLWGVCWLEPLRSISTFSWLPFILCHHGGKASMPRSSLSPFPLPLPHLPAQPITALSLEAPTEDKVFPVQSLKVLWLAPVFQGHPSHSSASVEWSAEDGSHLPSVSSHRRTGLSGSGIACRPGHIDLDTVPPAGQGQNWAACVEPVYLDHIHLSFLDTPRTLERKKKVYELHVLNVYLEQSNAFHTLVAV